MDSLGDRYYVYVLRSERTGRRYVGSCQDVRGRLRSTTRGDRNPLATVSRGYWYTWKISQHGPPRHDASVSTRQVGGARNSMVQQITRGCNKSSLIRQSPGHCS